ncbi:MAG: hypothetical protein JWO81_135 [Alphaproteobacteria bacterium]|nr:hypothetical protein [Alphaproteobacteria bacterium]
MVTGFDLFLQRGYYIAQIVLAGIALAAAWLAYLHVRTFKLFEILKYIENDPIRDARRIVIQKIEGQGTAEWWLETNSKLEAAASKVCSTYDVVGLLVEFETIKLVMIRPRYWGLFEKYWAVSIYRTHEALRSFLAHRRLTAPNAYEGYTRLAQLVKPYVPAPTIEIIAKANSAQRPRPTDDVPRFLEGAGTKLAPTPRPD